MRLSDEQVSGDEFEAEEGGGGLGVDMGGGLMHILKERLAGKRGMLEEEYPVSKVQFTDQLSSPDRLLQPPLQPLHAPPKHLARSPQSRR